MRRPRVGRDELRDILSGRGGASARTMGDYLDGEADASFWDALAPPRRVPPLAVGGALAGAAALVLGLVAPWRATGPAPGGGDGPYRVEKLAGGVDPRAEFRKFDAEPSAWDDAKVIGTIRAEFPPVERLDPDALGDALQAVRRNPTDGEVVRQLRKIYRVPPR